MVEKIDWMACAERITDRKQMREFYARDYLGYTVDPSEDEPLGWPIDESEPSSNPALAGDLAVAVWEYCGYGSIVELESGKFYVMAGNRDIITPHWATAEDFLWDNYAEAWVENLPYDMS